MIYCLKLYVLMIVLQIFFLLEFFFWKYRMENHSTPLQTSLMTMVCQQLLSQTIKLAFCFYWFYSSWFRCYSLGEPQKNCSYIFSWTYTGVSAPPLWPVGGISQQSIFQYVFWNNSFYLQREKIRIRKTAVVGPFIVIQKCPFQAHIETALSS